MTAIIAKEIKRTLKITKTYYNNIQTKIDFDKLDTMSKKECAPENE